MMCFGGVEAAAAAVDNRRRACGASAAADIDDVAVGVARAAVRIMLRCMVRVLEASRRVPPGLVFLSKKGKHEARNDAKILDGSARFVSEV